MGSFRGVIPLPHSFQPSFFSEKPEPFSPGFQGGFLEGFQGGFLEGFRFWVKRMEMEGIPSGSWLMALAQDLEGYSA